MTSQGQLLKEIAVELTVLTRETVRADITDYSTDYLLFPNGGRLAVGNVPPSRLHISAVTPEGVKLNCYHSRPEIHCTNSRTTAAIAADIARRLLRPARLWWDDCRAQQQDHDQKAQAVTQVCEALAPFMQRGHLRDELSADLFGPGLRAQVYSDGKVHRLEISELTLPQALQLLDLLKSFTS